MRVEPQIVALPPSPPGDDFPISRALTFGGGGISSTSEARLSKKRKWYHDNKDRVSKSRAQYYKRNRMAIILKTKAWYQRNRSQVLETRKTQYLEGKEANREALNASRRKAYRDNGQRQLILNRKRYADHRDRINSNRRKWSRLQTHKLKDGYVRYLLSHGTTVPLHYWDAALVEAKRAQLQLKRKLESLCQNQKT